MSTSFSEIIQKRADMQLDNPAFTFIGESCAHATKVSFTSIARQAQLIARHILDQGIKAGDRIVISVTDPYEFILSFLGSLASGAVPVPTAPPIGLPSSAAPHYRQLSSIISVSRPSAIILSPALKSAFDSAVPNPPAIFIPSDNLKSIASQSGPGFLHIAQPDEVAFLQFTSGSTSKPKGVCVSHQNLISNTDQIMNYSLEVTSADVYCSWLPLFHDMGLICCVLASLAHAIPVVLMSPLLFLKRPVEWFRMISQYHGTISFAPNFAYGLCVKRITQAEMQGIDLSSWRVAGCAAEPIHAQTIREFIARFSKIGFKARSILPAYGLAENTVGAASRTPGQGIHIDLVNPTILEQSGTAMPADEIGKEVVCCGKVFPGHQMQIVDTEGAPLPERTVGEITMRGPSVMTGYFDDVESTSKALRNGWLHTGDLGYIAEGELYVCGRIKELIIVAGRNYYPVDIESLASEVAGIRKGNVVAFGSYDDQAGRELVTVCAEEESGNDSSHEDLQRLIQERVLVHLGLKVDIVLILPRGTLPKTSSGKLQRIQTRELYIQGALR